MVQWLGFHALSASGLVGLIQFLVEELRFPQVVQGGQGKKKGKKKKTTAAVTTIKNPTQNGSTFGSVLTKAVHVIINTPNFFSSFGGKQKWNLSRFPLGTNM